jgi:2-C-methyl-D-erythritol 4-phosphate cytidylyltransferase
MGGRRKPWLELRGEPLLLHTLRPFMARADVAAICVALGPEDAADPPTWIEELDVRITVVAGGATRALSVARAVASLPGELDVILVHDAARPLVDDAVIRRVIEEAAGGVGAVAGVPATDTVKVVGPDGRILDTPDRSRIWLAQTPQGFPAALLRDAMARLEGDPELQEGATDDASVVEALGGTVTMVEGDPRNLKVTRPADLPLADHLMGLRRHIGPSPGVGDAAPFRLLFVCTGNTCRSPMAEVLAHRVVRERAWEQVEVRSAGVAAFPGAPASPGAMRAAAADGLDLDGHRSTPLTPELVAWADLILTMSASHLSGVEAAGGGGKAALLTRFASADEGGAAADAGVPDPFGGDDATYRATYAALADLVSRAMARLEPVVSP